MLGTTIKGLGDEDAFEVDLCLTIVRGKRRRAQRKLREAYASDKKSAEGITNLHHFLTLQELLEIG